MTLAAAVRGHLLMQLQATAAAQGWSGAPAELQRLLQPLAWMADGVDRGDDSTLVALAVVACSQVRPLFMNGTLGGVFRALPCFCQFAVQASRRCVCLVEHQARERVACTAVGRGWQERAPAGLLVPCAAAARNAAAVQCWNALSLPPKLMQRSVTGINHPG